MNFSKIIPKIIKLIRVALRDSFGGPRKRGIGADTTRYKGIEISLIYSAGSKW
jgi:hypothetical protein